MGKNSKGRGKNGPKERRKRREQKRQKQERDKIQKAVKEVRRMSGLVGPDGKTPIQSDLPTHTYRAGGLRFDAKLTPDMLLTKAVQGAQQAVGQQIYAQVLQKTKSAFTAQTEAQTAASNVRDPFTLEPCAMAVFMYLSRELEYRDKIIEQLNDRLTKLGAEPLDLTHPYPIPDPVAAQEEAEGAEEDGDEGEGEGEGEGDAPDDDGGVEESLIVKP